MKKIIDIIIILGDDPTICPPEYYSPQAVIESFNFLFRFQRSTKIFGLTKKKVLVKWNKLSFRFKVKPFLSRSKNFFLLSLISILSFYVATNSRTTPSNLPLISHCFTFRPVSKNLRSNLELRDVERVTDFEIIGEKTLISSQPIPLLKNQVSFFLEKKDEQNFAWAAKLSEPQKKWKDKFNFTASLKSKIHNFVLFEGQAQSALKEPNFFFSYQFLPNQNLGTFLPPWRKIITQYALKTNTQQDCFEKLFPEMVEKEATFIVPFKSDGQPTDKMVFFDMFRFLKLQKKMNNFIHNFTCVTMDRLVETLAETAEQKEFIKQQRSLTDKILRFENIKKNSAGFSMDPRISENYRQAENDYRFLLENFMLNEDNLEKLTKKNENSELDPKNLNQLFVKNSFDVNADINFIFEVNSNLKLTYNLTNKVHYYAGPFEIVTPFETNTLGDGSVIVIKEMNPYFQNRKRFLDSLVRSNPDLLEGAEFRNFYENLNKKEYPYIVEVQNSRFQKTFFEPTLIGTYHSKKTFFKTSFPIQAELNINGSFSTFFLQPVKPFFKFPIINVNLNLKKAGIDIGFNNKLEPISFKNMTTVWSCDHQILVASSYRGFQISINPFQKGDFLILFDSNKFLDSFQKKQELGCRPSCSGMVSM